MYKNVHSPITAQLWRPGRCHLLAGRPNGTHITTPLMTSPWLGLMGEVLLCDGFIVICGIWELIVRTHGLRICGSIHWILQMGVPFGLERDPFFALEVVLWNMSVYCRTIQIKESFDFVFSFQRFPLLFLLRCPWTLGKIESNEQWTMNN